MSEIKHTPWIARETRVYFGNNAGGFDLRNCPDPEEKARLIAAAPELLEALKAFAKIEIDIALEIVPNGYADPSMWRAHILRARAAIAKARGAA